MRPETRGAWRKAGRSKPERGRPDLHGRNRDQRTRRQQEQALAVETDEYLQAQARAQRNDLAAALVAMGVPIEFVELDTPC